MASWNVHGGVFGKVDGVSDLVRDLVKLKVDIACLQETHCSEERRHVEKGCGMVICQEVPDTVPVHQRYGLGFFISSALEPYYIGEKRV